MQAWRDRLALLAPVTTFDYDYMREERRRPDRLPQLVAAHRAALQKARSRRDQPVFLAGKSMGGRVGCHLSLEEPVTGLICFGYPLCGMGDRARMRDEVLRALRTPILFLQGTRDRLCPLDLLEEVRRKMAAPNFLHVVEGGDHSLMVSRRLLAAQGRTEEDLAREMMAAITRFLEEAGKLKPV